MEDPHPSAADEARRTTRMCGASLPLGRLVILTLFTVAVVNAGYNTITKDALSKGKVDALVFSLLRDACAYPILQLAAYCIDGPLWPKRGDVPLLFLLGLTGMFGNQFLFIEGLDHISADVASILNLAQAPIAAAVAVAVGQEQFSWRRLGGIGLAVCGAVVLLAPWQAGNSSKGKAEGSSKAVGYLCVLGSCCSMATYYIVQKPALRRYPPLSVTAWSYFFGALIMALAATSRASRAGAWQISRQAAEALVFAVIANSVIKYALQSFANKHVQASTVTAWSTAVPVFTAIFAFVDPNQHEDPLQLRFVGMIPIAVGVYLVTPRPPAVTRDVDQGSASDVDASHKSASDPLLSGSDGNGDAGTDTA